VSQFFVYQAYGRPEFYLECVYSILSLLRFYNEGPPPFKIFVYTDNKQAMQGKLPESVEFIELPAGQFQAWRGDIDFVHRVKVEMLRDFTKRVSGSIIYVDTDTYFLKDPAPIFEKIGKGTRFLHLLEDRVDSKSNPILKKMYRFLKKRIFSLKDGRNVKMPVSVEMWNAGLIGFSSQDKSLLEDVLELTDLMYSQYEKHVMEQLAFSFVLQTEGSLLPAEDYVYHYWAHKDFRNAIESFFAETKAMPLPDVVQATEKLNPANEKPEPRRSRWRVFHKILNVGGVAERP